MECEQVVREELAERYLRGALVEADREAVERHYFECASCFDELETLRALRQALAQGAAARQPARESRARSLPWMWAAAAAVVVSVGAGLYWSILASSGGIPAVLGAESRRPQEFPEGPSRPVAESASPVVSEVTAPAEARPPAQGAASLAALAVVQPPAYAPMLLRGTQDEAMRRFREAMRHYVEGEFATAKTGLEAAAVLDPAAPDIAFFLGICALLTDQPAPAIEHLRRTIAIGESPYLEEAHLFIAKAHLKLGELDAAASQLEEVIRLRGDREREARELLQRLADSREARPDNRAPQGSEGGQR